MPIFDHTGAARQIVGADGRRYAVYVMGPAGLLTIDPGVVFSPQPGSVSGRGRYAASASITCNVAAVWTYGTLGPYTRSSIRSGTSASAITFSITSPGTVGNRQTVDEQVSVTATVGGTSYSWTVFLTAQGDRTGIE